MHGVAAISSGRYDGSRTVDDMLSMSIGGGLA